MASSILKSLQSALSTVADVRLLLVLCVASFCVTVDIVEGQYTVITSSDTFPPASFLYVITTEALSSSATVNVWLGADQSFLLVDKSAKLLPSPSQFKAEAHPYSGNKCQFDTTVRLSTLFPSVPTTFVYWTQPTVTASPSASGTRSGSAVFWQFTNPSEGHLNQQVTRFCYSFTKPAVSGKDRRLAVAGAEASTNTAAHDTPATAEIWPPQNAEGQDKRTSSPASDDATNAPVVVLIFHSRAFGLTPSTACTIIILLSVFTGVWLAA